MTSSTFEKKGNYLPFIQYVPIFHVFRPAPSSDNLAPFSTTTLFLKVLRSERRPGYVQERPREMFPETVFGAPENRLEDAERKGNSFCQHSFVFYNSE